jgi:hypothetical protein
MTPEELDSIEKNAERFYNVYRSYGATVKKLCASIRTLWAEREAQERRTANLRGFVEFVSFQFCERSPKESDQDGICQESGDCITEWCIPCHARALIRDSSKESNVRMDYRGADINPEIERGSDKRRKQ